MNTQPTPSPDNASIHVLHVLPALGAGGMELAAARVVRTLTGSGMRHSVVALTGSPDPAVQFGPEVPVHLLHARPKDPTLPLRLRRLIERIRPSVIHARNWSAWPDVAAARLMTRTRPPLIFSFHGLDHPGDMPLRRRLACRALAGVTTCMFTVSRASRRMLVHRIGLPARRIRVISNGVDTDRFLPPRARHRHRRMVVGTVGNLTAVKNQALLIRAWTRLANLYPDVELRIAGDGPKAQMLRLLARSLGFGRRIRFAGHVADVPAFLRELDVFALPSDSEAHPNALLEAMACGLPCVATGVGGVADVLGGRKFGRTVAPRDVEAMAHELMVLAWDPSLRRRLGATARRRVCDRYDMRRMTRRYDRLYRQAAGGYRRLPTAAAPAGTQRPAVVMLGPLPPPFGGMATVMTHLRDSDLARRCRLTVVNTAKTTAPGRSLGAGLWAQGRLLWRLARAMRKVRARLVHVHTCSGLTFWRDAVLMLLARMLGGRGLWHIHGGHFERFAGGLPAPGRLALRWLLESASGVIVLGESWAQRLRPFAPHARWRVIPNAVPIPPGVRRRHHKAPGFLFLGDLAPAKGVNDLVAATRLAAEQGFDGVVLLAGGETAQGQAAELRRQVERAGCKEIVRLLGPVTGQRKRRAFARADCLVLPSRAEGMPMALLEGMAHGLAVVATRVGAVPEAVRDGVDGVLLDPGDVDSLTRAMLRLAADEPLRHRMGQAARRSVRKNFSIELAAEAIMNVYREALAGSER